MNPILITTIVQEELLNKYEALVEKLLDGLDPDTQFVLWDEGRKAHDALRRERFEG